MDSLRHHRLSNSNQALPVFLRARIDAARDVPFRWANVPLTDHDYFARVVQFTSHARRRVIFAAMSCVSFRLARRR
jgi:hypothetical protein